MLDNYSPDIVVGCETWLKPSILDNEIFPQNYNLFRTDRSDGFGGVLIGTKMHLNSELIHVSSSCEICVVKIHVSCKQKLISYNRYL